jgi:hypothetical protein
MFGLFYNSRKIVIIIFSTFFLFLNIEASASFDIAAFVDNMDDRNDQTVLTGDIDEMTINRGGVEFHLGPGTVTLFDFGAARPCAFVYKGTGTFFYAPPDEVERGQLLKFKKRDLLNEGFKKAIFFYTIEFDNQFDTSTFTRTVVDKGPWNDLRNAVEDAFDHLGIHMPNKLLGDLLAGLPGTYFHADFHADDSGHLIFREDPTEGDQYTLYHLKRRAGSDSYDVIGGFSTDGLLPSQRGLSPIDIRHYTIESEIGQSGKMMVKCRIEFAPARGGYPFLYFGWYYRNKIESILDSSGDSLTYVYRKNEGGFGVVLNKLPEFGQTDYIDVYYECKNLDDVYGIFYVKSRTYWYPVNMIRDQAKYHLIYDIPKSLEIVSCGNCIENSETGDRAISRWVVDRPVDYVSFNLGTFDKKEVVIENCPPVKTYINRAIPHTDYALFMAYLGELSTRDMLGQVSSDVTNSLAYFSSILGPCPFDTLKAAELFTSFYSSLYFGGGGQGSPGLIHLAWDTFLSEDIEGKQEAFRAHEVAHQWWGHVVDVESYRDVWITEGLATFCGLWYYELSSKNRGAVSNMLKNWRDNIISGRAIKPVTVVRDDSLQTIAMGGGNSVGHKAGPPIIGYRLSSSKSDDYYINVYLKGGYIFHMIRYILRDYKTGSDDVFAAFLKSMVDKFRGKVITTALLQKHLEEFTGEDVSWFFDQWVYGTEIPKYKFGYTYTETDDGKYAVTCNVKQEKVPDNFRMLVPITVLFPDEMYIHLKLWIDQPEMTIELPKLPYKPEKIVFNTFDAVLCKVDYE